VGDGGILTSAVTPGSSFLTIRGLAVHQEQNTVIALAQPNIVGVAKSRPHLLSRHSGVSDRQHVQALRIRTIRALIPQGPKNRDYVVASL